MQKLKILMILIGVVISSSCTTVKYKKIHDPLTVPYNCIFEKFTQEEANYLESAPIGDKIGRKIYRNNHSCETRQKRINSLIKTHNEEHKN